ncbi:ricin-type beta-trefoil lectin domain protein [Streptomyces sp. NPDC048669]|uniref:RICIN domain-containing protein n=1 Tax=Streptomyces sp. NPDC048669 TaxID=3155267 RepID=UPI003443E427
MSKATIWDKNFVDLLYKYCLDDSSGAHLRMNTCSDASYDNGYQRWTVTQDGDEYKFKNADTHLCLDGSAGAGVRTYACSDASYNNGYQMWKRVYSVTSNGTTWVAWGNVATGKCMDYSLGDHLKLKPCSSASFNNGYQAWNY